MKLARLERGGGKDPVLKQEGRGEPKSAGTRALFDFRPIHYLKGETFKKTVYNERHLTGAEAWVKGKAEPAGRTPDLPVAFQDCISRFFHLPKDL